MAMIRVNTLLNYTEHNMKHYEAANTTTVNITYYLATLINVRNSIIDLRQEISDIQTGYQLHEENHLAHLCVELTQWEQWTQDWVKKMDDYMRDYQCTN
ncbi:unnamed protein product [Medioppia subpectinata]|uniref:Uncharacterized protein n=1 Tax=Medioppia subpectinata TaxID=1979941 RepID=A0A7R9L2E0_9ACAR|nr:unnamed protein product [Medioppia subpectinata]CAG2113106.1 unnamed protein product [Medioppia subpectinata]